MSWVDPPPFVLVHGAYHGGWCWAPVAKILRSHGHDVFTPTQSGLGERRHLLSSAIDMEVFVLDILNVIEFEQLENVVLVGHSFGARSINGVVDRVPNRVKQLIYIDGGLAPDGLSRLESMTQEAREKRIQSSMASDGGVSVPPPSAQEFGITDAETCYWVNRLMTPQPLSADRAGLRLNNPLGNGRPATYIRCVDPPFPVVETSARYAKNRPDWRFVEVNAGHNAIVTHAVQIAQILLSEIAH